MRAAVVGVTLAFLLGPGSAIGQSTSDAAVFDAALEYLAVTAEGSVKYLVFNETANARDELRGHMGQAFPEELMKELRAANTSQALIPWYAPPKPYRSVSRKDLGEAVGSGWCCRWDAFHARFPDAAGVLQLAWPAYSADRGQALVYLSTGCGLECAAGYLCLLVYSHGSWVVLKWQMVWIA